MLTSRVKVKLLPAPASSLTSFSPSLLFYFSMLACLFTDDLLVFSPMYEGEMDLQLLRDDIFTSPAQIGPFCL